MAKTASITRPVEHSAADPGASFKLTHQGGNVKDLSLVKLQVFVFFVKQIVRLCKAKKKYTHFIEFVKNQWPKNH